MDLKLFETIEHRCPDCGHKWRAPWDSNRELCVKCCGESFIPRRLFRLVKSHDIRAGDYGYIEEEHPFLVQKEGDSLYIHTPSCDDDYWSVYDLVDKMQDGGATRQGNIFDDLEKSTDESDKDIM